MASLQFLGTWPRERDRRAPASRARGRVLLAILGALALGAASGCVTETVAEPAGVLIFDWADTGLETQLVRGGTAHSVELFFELDPENDLPPGDGDYQTVLFPYVDSVNEVYRVFDGLHEITYRGGDFSVAGWRFHAEKGVSLYIFKPRPAGVFRFTFRKQPIEVVSEQRWTPIIYHRLAYRREPSEAGDGDRRSNRLGRILGIEDVVRVGHAVIETDSETPQIWQVGGSSYTPSTSRPLRLEGSLDYDSGSAER
jgi:hypothetical protein